MISLADIKNARERIRDSVYLSPAPQSETLSRATGNALCLKLENLQMTGSFKERGALNRILSLTPEERAHGVITASAGNHGQAVAYHASRRGIPAQICMPVYTPITKLNAVKGYGGEAVLVGANYDEAMQEARRREATEHRTYLSAFDDDAVIAGQGTIGLELLEQVPDLEAVVVPVGGGGLISGIACAMKESKPGVRVIGVQTTVLPSMLTAMREHKPVLLPPGSTVADGIAVRKVGERTLALCEKYVDEILTVDDEEIAMAVLWLLEKEKTLAEGAGAAGMAAMLNHKTGLRGKKVAVVLSGGNMDVTTLSGIIERGLVKDGRLVRLRVTLSDHPGGLQALTTVIAEERANIVQVTHDRTYFGVHLGETSVDITMETRGPEHVAELLGKLTAAGYVHQRVT
ncbi:MAG: threonine ammonia-lyase [Bryobacteraceae bacterium]